MIVIIGVSCIVIGAIGYYVARRRERRYDIYYQMIEADYMHRGWDPDNPRVKAAIEKRAKSGDL